MTLSAIQKKDIKNILRTSIRNKFKNYKPEPASMPFHLRLLGKNRLVIYQFIHSLNTNFGTSIFEPIAITIAKEKFKSAERHISAGNKISSEALIKIQSIMDGLNTSAINPNQTKEIEIIRKVCKKGKIRTVKPTKVDIFLKSKDGKLFLIDLKTAKPNRGEFKEFKRNLLEWVGVTLFETPEAKINTLIAIPYNPYEPNPYNRWTMAGMLDLKKELKVGEEFWDFLGGRGDYEDILDCFEQIGIELRPEINKYFDKFKH
jgi:type II restriction enzyme